MINENKWIETLAVRKNNNIEEKDILDPNIWVDTLPQTQTKKNNPIRKYSFTAVLFIFGIILVSAIKNETRGLQNEIYTLKTSISETKLNLHKASLDYAVITSPENIYKLAEKYLESDLLTYKKSQIKNINSKNEKNLLKDNTKVSKKLIIKVEEKIKNKKEELKKLQNLVKKPKKLPGEIKLHLVKKIEAKKKEIKSLYRSPEGLITSTRVRRWAGVQIVKAFLGIPIIPGK